MMNMAHCRFHNTLLALRECEEHWEAEDLSAEEQRSRTRLQRLINQMAEDPEDREQAPYRAPEVKSK